jgi:hypothetical protein
MTPLPLPDYLSDLQFSLGGKVLALYPVSWAEGMYAVGFEVPTDTWGLFVNLEGEHGKLHDSQTVEVYRDGRVYSHVRTLHDHVGTPQAFSEWLRGKVAKLIHNCVRGHIGGTYYQLDKNAQKADVSTIETMCRVIAAQPPLPEVEWFSCQVICDALTALLNAHERGTMSQHEAALVRGFLDEYSEPPFRRDLRDKTIEHAFVLLPDVVPAAILDYLETQAKKQLGNGELSVEGAASVGPFLERQPAHLRPIYNGLLLPLCDTPELCFAVATALSANPETAAEYADRGLQLSPTHAGLLHFTELLGGRSHSFKQAAAKAKQYEELIPKVLYEGRSPDLKGNDKKLLDTQAWLNRFWMSVLPPREAPGWEQAVDTMCRQIRFKVRGSEAYLKWCRFQGKNDEGAAFFLRCLQDLELLQLQHRSDYHCPGYLSQGFSCMLDTQRPEHIEQALEVIDKLEAVLTWKSTDVYYALACVTSRAGQIMRAVGYAKRCVELGGAVEPMFTDPDFANLMNNPWAEPRLRKLGD